MKKIVVIGSNGQLGNCIRKIAPSFEHDYEFIFTDSNTLDITNEDQINDFFYNNKPEYCINAAAYTAVDLAEKEEEKVFTINAEGVGFLAQTCSDFKTLLIHVSTDYVFDGETNLCYSEDDFTNPQGVYGRSKLKGEELALERNFETIILRTSWLYSEFNNNFVKTMLRLFSQKDELGIVADQFGQPTNANDLAETIMNIVEAPNKEFGIYHFSNYPETTWFNFAKKIADFTNSSIRLKPLTSEEYPTAAKRPKRSTMCLDKIEETYHIELKHWENSLEECIEILST
ncbi:dTDP-4-dehydrorhamnose reductase [Chryseobacterium nematophagum]|uniref:dTDP-4-dehydrorhamnose reductase n=1 Tax=Chryseobacterium nematophagum TaxID=2305228 RepID=A0A3M7TF95_9FLAO|nr:dTDP-4-dehydrorhamnose reductase [Chryseobacterium nematophagum]RNA61309.1 dTDP-4-dehydrorhamnose reductase [Chryseobacterium nematophagum]